MLVFIDESGDPGRDIDKGASRYFSIALLVFEDHEEALACDKRMELVWQGAWMGRRFRVSF